MLQSFKNLVLRLPPVFMKKPPAPTMSEKLPAKKSKYDGRIKKRQWEDRRSDKGEGLRGPKVQKNETEVTQDMIERIKRRKFAMLLSYSGTDYYGMQRNPASKTIEEELFRALAANKYITDENFAQVQTMQFQRAARTDKGVSAARQVVSMKLPENIEVPKINEHLPEVIRVFGIKRVTKGFNSKTLCDSRTYFYMLPTVAFVPHTDHMHLSSFRLDPAILERVNELLKKYVGTKNFHNFTLKKKPDDPSVKRYIMSFLCDPPFVEKDVEFVVMKVRGQSFMMHQIRKMVGLVIAVAKGLTGEDTIDRAFFQERVNIPRAPGLGLVLDYVHYQRYNFRYGQDGVHEGMDWDKEEGDVQAFKEKYIYPNIIDTEIKEEAMINWIVRKLSGHTFDASEADDNDEEDDEGVKGDDNEDDCKQEGNDKKEEEEEKGSKIGSNAEDTAEQNVSVVNR